MYDWHLLALLIYYCLDSCGPLGSVCCRSLEHNTMEGPVLDTLTRSNSLTYLFLGDNQFTGTIPINLGEALPLLVTL